MRTVDLPERGLVSARRPLSPYDGAAPSYSGITAWAEHAGCPRYERSPRGRNEACFVSPKWGGAGMKKRMPACRLSSQQRGTMFGRDGTGRGGLFESEKKGRN